MLIKKFTRRQFFDQFLRERQAQDPTPELEQEMQILQEMLDELDDIDCSCGRERKFVGSIKGIYFENGYLKKIGFGTEELYHLFGVDEDNSEVMVFLQKDYDLERHRRYDKGIDTTLVATVKFHWVKKITWRVPWDETESKWFITDDDCFQCCKVVHQFERVYELIQINSYSFEGMEPFHRISSGLISLNRYSDEDILKYMRPYGFNSMEQFIKEHDGILYWQYIAEMIFETTCLEYEACQRYHSFEAAAGVIKNITGLTIPGMEDKSLIVPSEQ